MNYSDLTAPGAAWLCVSDAGGAPVRAAVLAHGSGKVGRGQEGPVIYGQVYRDHSNHWG